MVAAALMDDSRRKAICVISILMVLTMPLATFAPNYESEGVQGELQNRQMGTQGDSTEVWIDGGQPWPQFGRTASRIADVPEHSPGGGAGFEDPANASSMMSIVEPSLNWVYGSYSIGTDSLATPVADLGGSVEVGLGAEERCGKSSLFSILIQTQEVAGSAHSMLRLIEGEDSELAWQVDLGATEKVKAAPVVVDIDEDGRPEIVVAYDAGGSLNVDVWSPRLACSVTGWSYSGCLLYTSPSPRDATLSRMPSSA